MTDRNVRFHVLHSAKGKWKWTVRRTCITEQGIPSISDLKSFDDKKKAEAFKKQQEDARTFSEI